MGFTEKNTSGCVKQSTKCFFYFGKKLHCINVDSGESLDSILCKIDATFKNIYKEFDLANYSYEDLVPEGHCPPKTFKDLINLILSQFTQTVVTNQIVAQDLTVSVAPCDIAVIGGETTNALQYLAYLGQKSCTQAQEIINLTEALAQANLRMDDLQNQINALV